MQFFQTEEKYHQWRTTIYEPAYEKAHDLHLYNGETEKQAQKKARQDAVKVVVQQAPGSA